MSNQTPQTDELLRILDRLRMTVVPDDQGEPQYNSAEEQSQAEDEATIEAHAVRSWQSWRGESE